VSKLDQHTSTVKTNHSTPEVSSTDRHYAGRYLAQIDAYFEYIRTLICGVMSESSVDTLRHSTANLSH